MNEDALAAVVAAARLLVTRDRDTEPAPAAARWNLAARMHTGDAAGARLIARARSRWAFVGRLRD